MSNIDPPNLNKTPFRILSVDGGGVRGIIPLVILQEIENKTGKKTSQLFDLIIGNSTGGIIALSLAAQENNTPKYSAQDLLHLYMTKTPQIFAKSIFRTLFTGLGLWAPKYDRSNLDAVLQEFVGDLFLSQVGCHTIVTSYSLTQDAPRFWSSNQAQKDANSNILMRDAAGATSAAPTYFAPKLITLPDKSTTCEVDGGIYINDPESLAITEALTQNPVLTPDQIFVLSLGTGRPKLKEEKDHLTNAGLFGWLAQVNLIDLMLNADTQLGELEVKSFSAIQRCRLQLDLDSQYCAMDNVDPQNLQGLQQLAQNFIEQSQDTMNQIYRALNPTCATLI